MEKDFDLRTLFEIVPAMVCIASTDGYFKYLNPEWEKVLGYSLEELLSRPLFDFIHPDDHEPTQQEIERQVKGKMTLNFKNRYRCKDGLYKTFEWRASAAEGDKLFAVARDITESKKAEEALRRSEVFLDSIIEHGPHAMWISDDKGTLIRLNQACRDLLHITDDEVVGKYNVLQDNIVVEQGFMPMVNKVFTKGETAKFTLDYDSSQLKHLALEQKARVVLEVTISPVLDADGRVTNAIIQHIDITEHQRAEEALRESEALLNKSQAIAHIGSWELDIVADRLTWSDEVYRIFGLRPQEFGATYKAFIDAVHPEDRTTVDAAYSGSVQEGRDTYEIQHRIIRRDNSEVRVVQEKCEHVRDFSGRIVRSIGMVQDITERKQAEEALRESEESLRTIFNSSPDYLMLLDLDHKIQFINRVETGLKKDDVIGKPLYTFAIPDAQARVKTHLDRVVRELKKEQYDTIYAHPDGKEIHFTSVVAPVIVSGQVIGSVVNSRNVTEQINLEDQLRQSQKAEALGTLAGGIAHEFNNIMGIILGNAELAIDDVPEWNPAKDSLKEIRKASLRAKDVVRQILSFARKTPAERKPFQISTVIKESLKLMRATIPTTVEIQQNILCESEMILADQTEISQVLINLCKNAAHAIGAETGVVKVSLENEELERKNEKMSLEPGRYVKLTVKDTGKGIDPQIKDRIFDPYFTTKSLAEASGMGLAIVYGIVKKHDGGVRVRSEVGKGTVVEVLFPLTEAEAKVEAEKPQKMATGTERILFVDDEESIVKMIGEMLERLGYQVITKTDPTEALRLFKDDPKQFDLVITDMAMPQMAGDRLAQELMKIRKDVPVILCTGHSDRIDEESAKKMGLSAYVMKPLVMMDFANTIRKVLDDQKKLL